MLAQLILAGAGGVALGAIAAALGFAEWKHQNRQDASDDTVEFPAISRTPPILAEPRRRGR
jgi:hypothetical protein